MLFTAGLVAMIGHAVSAKRERLCGAKSLIEASIGNRAPLIQVVVTTRLAVLKGPAIRSIKDWRLVLKLTANGKRGSNITVAASLLRSLAQNGIAVTGLYA
jgi:hypothetical protein